MVIKIDMDGVIRNIFDNMCDIYNINFGTNISVDDIFDYDVEIVFPKIREKFGMSAADYFFKEKSVDIFLLSKPYDGVKEALEKLRKNGHKVVIVTWQYTVDNKLRTLKVKNHDCKIKGCITDALANEIIGCKSCIFSQKHSIKLADSCSSCFLLFPRFCL